MTHLLKPLFHNTSTLLISSAVTPPPSVSSLSCSPAPPLLTQHAPVDCSDDQNAPILAPEPSAPPLSMTKALQGEFDPLQCSPSRTIISQNPHQTSTAPLVSHSSAPPSLNSSPHEHTVVPHPSSSSIPSLSSQSHPSSITPFLVDLSGPGAAPQTQPQPRLPLLSQSESQLQFQPESQLMSRSYPHSLSLPQLQPSSVASHLREPLLNLQEVDWGERTAQLSFINEGQPSV